MEMEHPVEGALPSTESLAPTHSVQLSPPTMGKEKRGKCQEEPNQRGPKRRHFYKKNDPVSSIKCSSKGQ